MKRILDSGKKAQFFVMDSAFSGVRKIAEKVCRDYELVLAAKPELRTCTQAEWAGAFAGATEDEIHILVATEGRDLTQGTIPELDDLLGQISGKREVYAFTLMQISGSAPVLVILGSDKRGTIYGLFHLSEVLGVSPWVYFADALPAKKASLVLTDADNKVTKEPSVKYRGFFINDEWPAFGNWTFEHFGGFTAEMYDHVFELILRLKGNYLWPAMWTSNFSCDGPGMLSAELADEYGIVMSNSHHEPCLRHSEEWDKVKGEDTPYGTAWNFDRNRQGLLNYWRGGLKRNGALENIITIGMRGERDSEVLGRTATLQENIDYLKDVITCQNRLIEEELGDRAKTVPRMLAVYKEVERYYEGDETTPGLKTWDGLNGVTLMLCEDNQGNMRGLPAPEERDREGGFGMYYHFDYHGDPNSYEWICSTHLPKVWEQMTECFECGVRDIWIVNVGDLKPQELPLSFFLDLAYDYDAWGSGNLHAAEEYLNLWISRTFGEDLTSEEHALAYELLDGYTYLNSIRKPEVLWSDTYHTAHYGESEAVLRYCGTLRTKAEQLRTLLKQSGREYLLDAYDQLIYLPVLMTANQHEMMLNAGQNEYRANAGMPSANVCAETIAKCRKEETRLRDAYHALNGGKWNGMMLSQHVGFRFWNEEENRYPVRSYVDPIAKERIIVSLPRTGAYSMGGDWTRRPLFLTDFVLPGTESAQIRIENGGEEELSWTAEVKSPWLTISAKEGKLPSAGQENPNFCLLDVKLLPEELKKVSGGEDAPFAEGRIEIRSAHRRVDLVVIPGDYSDEEQKNPHLIPVLSGYWQSAVHPAHRTGAMPGQKFMTSMGDEIGLTLDACDYASIEKGTDAEFVCIGNYNKYGCGLKAMPIRSYTPGKDAPAAVYEVCAPEAGEYEITVLTAPSNPINGEKHLRFGLRAGNGEIRLLDTITPDFKGGDSGNFEWSVDVLRQEHRAVCEVSLQKGSNNLTLYACDPGLVFERILVRKAGTAWAEGYLGKLPERLAK